MQENAEQTFLFIEDLFSAIINLLPHEKIALFVSFFRFFLTLSQADRPTPLPMRRLSCSSRALSNGYCWNLLHLVDSALVTPGSARNITAHNKGIVQFDNTKSPNSVDVRKLFCAVLPRLVSVRYDSGPVRPRDARVNDLMGLNAPIIRELDLRIWESVSLPCGPWPQLQVLRLSASSAAKLRTYLTHLDQVGTGKLREIRVYLDSRSLGSTPAHFDDIRSVVLSLCKQNSSTLRAVTLSLSPRAEDIRHLLNLQKPFLDSSRTVQELDDHCFQTIGVHLSQLESSGKAKLWQEELLLALYNGKNPDSLEPLLRMCYPDGELSMVRAANDTLNSVLNQWDWQNTVGTSSIRLRTYFQPLLRPLLANGGTWKDSKSTIIEVLLASSAVLTDDTPRSFRAVMLEALKPLLDKDPSLLDFCDAPLLLLLVNDRSWRGSSHLLFSHITQSKTLWGYFSQNPKKFHGILKQPELDPSFTESYLEVAYGLKLRIPVLRYLLCDEVFRTEGFPLIQATLKLYQTQHPRTAPHTLEEAFFQTAGYNSTLYLFTDKFCQEPKILSALLACGSWYSEVISRMLQMMFDRRTLSAIAKWAELKAAMDLFVDDVNMSAISTAVWTAIVGYSRSKSDLQTLAELAVQSFAEVPEEVRYFAHVASRGRLLCGLPTDDARAVLAKIVPKLGVE